MPPPPDRRAATRHELTLPLQVRIAQPAWADLPPLPDTCTKDISTRGIGFTFSGNCDPGSAIDCVVLLPGGAAGEPAVQLRLRGKIVRVYRSHAEAAGDPGRVAVGATIEQYSLRFA